MRLMRSVALALILSIWTTPQAFALTATPASLTFQAVQGGANPASQSINVSKSSNKTTNWTASDSASWVSVSPSTGSIMNTVQVTVTVNTAGLAPGTYAATIAVTVSKGGSVSIPVSVTVTPATTTATPTTTSSPTTTTSTSTTTTASLSWSPPSNTAVAGYNVYMGTTSGVYGPKIDVGNVTSYVLSNLSTGTYYFVVTDYNSSAVESPPSNEVSKTIY